MDKVNFVVCYHTRPGKFKREDIFNLEAQVNRWAGNKVNFFCFTNDTKTHQFPNYIPIARTQRDGNLSVPESLRMMGPTIFVGLDTIITAPIDELIDLALNCPEKTVYMTHVVKLPNDQGRLFCNGVMIWNGDLSWIYDDFNYEWVIRHSKVNNLFEQDYTSAMLIKNGYEILPLQKYVKGIYHISYELRELGFVRPDDCKVVVFQGDYTPRNMAVKHKWIRKTLGLPNLKKEMVFA